MTAKTVKFWACSLKVAVVALDVFLKNALGPKARCIDSLDGGAGQHVLPCGSPPAVQVRCSLQAPLTIISADCQVLPPLLFPEPLEPLALQHLGPFALSSPTTHRGRPAQNDRFPSSIRPLRALRICPAQSLGPSNRTTRRAALRSALLT